MFSISKPPFAWREFISVQKSSRNDADGSYNDFFLSVTRIARKVSYYVFTASLGSLLAFVSFVEAKIHRSRSSPVWP
jgi:hypothetical protein